MTVSRRVGFVTILATALAGAWPEGAAALSPLEKGVTNVKAFHRSGQTFITWQGVEDAPQEFTWGEARQILKASKLTYRIYAHDERITDASLDRAKLLGQVGPLSAWNLNGRNTEYLIGQAMIQPDQIGELARNYNGFIYSWHMDHARMDRYPLSRFVVDAKAGLLPREAGLYVHQADLAGKRYYAVLAFRGDERLGGKLDTENSPAEPVAESVGPGEPVCQGDGLWGPFFDYPGRRKVYVQWTAPPLSPRPNMYFNWSVLVPPDVKAPAPVELYFHTGNYTYAKPSAKLIAGSVQIAPHDYPFSGWYGYNDALAAGADPASGKVSNHTQKRIAAFLKWALKHFPVDADRVIAVGGDGAAAMALSYPELFAHVMVTGFEGRVLDRKAVRAYTAAWGPKDPNITDDRGRGEWGWADLDKLALASPGEDLPLFLCAGYSWGKIAGYAKGRGRFYSAMLQSRQPLVAGWGWSSTRNLGAIDKYTGVWRGMIVRRGTAVPAFSNSTLDRDTEADGQASAGYHWKDIQDEADLFQITITGRESTFDLTPRWLQKFKAKPGAKLAWEATSVPDRRGKTGPPQSGQVIVDEHGLVTVEKLKLIGGGLVVKIRAAG